MPLMPSTVSKGSSRFRKNRAVFTTIVKVYDFGSTFAMHLTDEVAEFDHNK